MGKINKFANLYDRNGKLIRHTDKDGVLKNITIPELEKMIDEYPKDGDALALDNMKMALFQMYNKYGDPHREELVKRILEEQAKKTKPEEVTDKLQELNDYIEENKTVNLELEKPWTEDGTDEMVAELNKDSEGDKTDEFEYVDEIPVGNGIWDQMETKAREYGPKQYEEDKMKGSADWLNDDSNIEVVYNDEKGWWERAKQTKVVEYDPEQHEETLNKYMQQIAAA